MTELFPLSVVVIAKNEAINIQRCLQSVAWCDERVVIDDHSQDATRDLARNCGARVVERKFDTFAGQRNWALEHADLKHEWVLMLDADEEVPASLKEEIERKLLEAAEEVVALRICRKTMLFERWLKYSDGFPVWIMRFVRRGKAWFADSGHGEVPIPEVDGKLQTLTTPIVHRPFSKGLGEWIERHNRYSTREARMEAQEKLAWRWGHVVSFDRAKRRSALRNLGRTLPCRGMLRFGYQYVWKRGFMDGRAGLTFSLLMGIYETFIAMKRRELEIGKEKD